MCNPMKNNVCPCMCIAVYQLHTVMNIDSITLGNISGFNILLQISYKTMVLTSGHIIKLKAGIIITTDTAKPESHNYYFYIIITTGDNLQTLTTVITLYISTL